jgi:hypothetical protein
MDDQKKELIEKFVHLNKANKSCLIALMSAVYTSQLNTETTIKQQYGLDQPPHGKPAA